MFFVPGFYPINNNAPLRLTSGSPFKFASPGPGRQNSLLVDTIELFGPQYAPDSFILYLQDVSNNITIYEHIWLAQLGLLITAPALLPDILLYHEGADMLFFIELVTMHGPIVQQRKYALEALSRKVKTRRVYVSVFFSYIDFKPHATSIAWDSCVWMAQIPDHIIYYQ